MIFEFAFLGVTFSVLTLCALIAIGRLDRQLSSNLVVIRCRPLPGPGRPRQS